MRLFRIDFDIAVAVAGRGLVDPHEPVFAADDEALLRGRAVFETARVYDGRPFMLDAHTERLQASAARVKFKRRATARKYLT